MGDENNVTSLGQTPWLHFVAAAFSGMGLALSFPDYGIWPLAWFTVAPFLLTLGGKTPSQGAKLGFVFGLFYFGPTLTWLSNTMIHFGHMPVWLAALVNGLGIVYVSFFTAFFGWLVAWIGRRAGEEAALAFSPLLWVAVELLRSHAPPLAFPWARIADSQYLFITFIQVADFCGEEGAGFVMLAVNMALARIISWKMTRGPFPLRWTALAFFIFAGCLVYGQVSVGKYSRPEGKAVHVALLQGNIDQARKWDRNYTREQARMYVTMTLDAASKGASLVVWPEAAATFFFGKDAYYDGLMKEVAHMGGASIFFGASDYEQIEGRDVSYNSAWLLSPAGDAKKYDKVRLAPFGEYVPLPRLLFFVHQIAHSVGDMTPGEKLFTLDTASYKMGPQICFEIIFPQYSAQLSAMGAQALVNITNDSWFGVSPASRQSLSMAVFRAVENRTPLLRAAQSGVSAIIAPDGRITDQTGLFVQTTLHGNFVPRQGPPTAYSLYGWFLAWIYPVGALAAILWASMLGRRKPTLH